jgi:hypothetical protein
MKRSGFGVCLFLTVAMLGAVASAAGADTTLRMKFRAGQKLGYVLTQTTSITAGMMGKKLEQSFREIAEMTWEVKSIDKDGNARMVQTIDRFRFESLSPSDRVGTMDTANGQDPSNLPAAMAKLFRAVAGASFTMTITPLGKIHDFAIPANVVQAIKDAGPSGVMLGSEEGLKDLAAQAFVPFPQTAIVQGDSWQGVRKLPVNYGTMVMDITYRLEAPAGPIENIGIDVKVKIEPTKSLPAEYKVTSQDTRGHYRFDNSVGILKESDMFRKLSTTVTVRGRQITEERETKAMLKLKKDDDPKSGEMK